MPPPRGPDGRFLKPDDAARQAQIEQFEQEYDVKDPGQARALPGAADAKPVEAHTPPPAVVTKPPYSKHLLRRAKQLGMQESDFEGWDAERLEDVVFGREHERNEQMRERLNRLEGMYTSPESLRPDPQPQPPPKAPEPADEILAEITRAYPELNEELAKGIVGAVRAGLKPVQERLDKVEQNGDLLMRAENHRAEMTFAEQADGFFSKHPEIYGTGRIYDLPKDSPFRAARQIVATGVDFNDVVGSLSKRHQTLYGHLKLKEAPKPAPEPAPAALRNGDTERLLAERQAEWQDAGLQAPTSRHEPEGKGRQAAISAIEGVLERARARDGEGAREKDESGIPD